MKIWARLKSDSGSAIVEFIALAIPLFIPIFIYLNHFSSVSVNEEIARSMAREVLRVYVMNLQPAIFLAKLRTCLHVNGS